MPLEIERKFLVDPATDPASFPVHVVPVDIRQVYLSSGGGRVERRVRERREVGHPRATSGVLHTYAEKKEVRPGVRQETERTITAREYINLLREKDPNRVEIVKRRYGLLWNGQYFELDFISSPIKLVVLEVELTDEQTQLVQPPFVKVIKEVTDDNRFTNASIAAGLCLGYRVKRD